MSYSGLCTSHPVEYCTYAYQTHFPWWLVYCVVGGGELNLCWACVPPAVTMLGCCYSCVMQSLAKQIQTDPKIVYQSGLTPAKVSLLVHLYIRCTPMWHIHMYVCTMLTHTHTHTCKHTHASTLPDAPCVNSCHVLPCTFLCTAHDVATSTGGEQPSDCL